MWAYRNCTDISEEQGSRLQDLEEEQFATCAVCENSGMIQGCRMKEVVNV